MQESDILVIGGGLGGLAAATLLARQGRRVRVLEQAEHPGGRARSRSERGFVHNLGAHALYNAGAARAVLAELGMSPTGGVVSGEQAYVVQGGRLRGLPYDAASLLRSEALGARGKLWFARLMLGLGERKARRLRGKTVRQWLDDEAPDARSRGLVEMFVRLSTYTHAPDLLSAEAAVRQLALAMRGSVRYLDGGWQTLVDGLLQRARQAGVQVELGCRAARIEHERDVRAVVTADGRMLAASAVVAAVPPQALSALLPGDALCVRWAETAVPVRAACLDLGTAGLPRPERVVALAVDAPLYFADHSACAALAPAGKHALHLVRYLAPGEDGRDAEPELRDFLELVQPGAYARAEVSRFMPNLTVHHDVPGSGRIPARHPEIAGLHLVGEFVSGPHMLLDAVLASARAAAEAIAAASSAPRSSPPRRSTAAGGPRDAERAA